MSPQSWIWVRHLTYWKLKESLDIDIAVPFPYSASLRIQTLCSWREQVAGTVRRVGRGNRLLLIRKEIQIQGI